MQNIIREFKNPPALYRPAPLWVWNDEMTEEAIAFQLKELAEHGFGGAFVHPRPGLVTEYLSERWFALWEYALNCAKKLGIKLYIYDENSYPSGFAGGHVSGIVPEGIAAYARIRIAETPEGVRQSGDCVGVYAATDNGNGLKDAVSLAGIPESEWKDYGNRFIAVHTEKQGATGWMAGFAYVDLMRPEVHDAFMETTHEQYFKRFGEDFRDAVPAIFTDEPSVGTVGRDALPFSFWFAHEFQKKNGYDLKKNLPLLFTDAEGDCFDHPAEKVRFDYYNTIHELWVKNGIEATGKWCADHHINWTGHYLEHQWPLTQYNTSPSIQSYYEFHQWPAIDMLLSNYLKDRPTHALTHTIRELRSASNQFGKERALCELYGAGGWDSSFEDYKRMGDWVLVNGVNFIDQHLTYSTIMGARKHDHPQSFDWRQPWWNEYAGMNDYIGRAQWMLTRGRMEQRILVLNPSTTAFLVSGLDASGDMFGNGNPDCIRNPDMTSFLTLCQTLTDNQWDYDLGDEYTLARHGRAENGALNVVKQHYAVVLVSGDMKNMLSSTAALLKSAAEAGVTILAAGKPGNRVDGMVNEAAYAELGKLWKCVTVDEIDACLGKLLPRRITADRAFPAGFDHMRRKLDNGDEVWFFVNHAMEHFEATLTLTGGGVKALDLFTGEIAAVLHTAENGTVRIPVSLVRNQSLMLYVTAEAAEVGKTKKKPAKAMKPELVGIRQESENTFPISYCDYTSGWGAEKDVYVKFLCDRIFRERGFASNPWDNKVQFRRNIMERDGDYDEQSGFTAAYRFTLDEGFTPEKLTLAAEHPEYCRLRVNGIDIPWNPGETWLDRNIGVADITAAVKPGENTAEIILDVFRVLFEIETIYLKGDFAVENRRGKWVLTGAKPLGYGSWKEQGRPFYSGAVTYEYKLTLDRAPEYAEIDVNPWGGTALSLTVNGEYAGLIHTDGRRAKEIAGLLKAGENKLVLRVAGNFKNLMGPHFERARGSAWPGMWRANPAHTPDAGTYDLLDFGLTDAPTLTAE